MDAPPIGTRFSGDRRFFIAAAAAIAVIVVAGFLPNYILRALHHNLSLLVNLHGLAMTAWIALFLVQTSLIAKRRVDLHRRLGMCGAMLIALMLMAGLPVLMNAAARQEHDLHGARFLLTLIAFDGLNLLLFAALAGCAIARRHRGDVHKRLMLLATLALLGPAFGRLTAYANGFRDDSDLSVLLLMQTCVLVCAAIDTRRHHRLHPVFAWAGMLVMAANLLTYAAKAQL